jgi:transcription elongation GreA/GreB family factor
VAEIVIRRDTRASPPSTAASRSQSDVGDRVLVSYSDDPSRYRTLVIREKDSDPENGILAASDPLAVALLGAAVDEEVSVPLDGDTHRIVTIFQIEKPELPAALTSS